MFQNLRYTEPTLKQLLRQITRVMLSAFSLLTLLPELRALSVIQLAQGAEVRAEIISEKADRVFADLGFTVLSIPKDSILDIQTATVLEDTSNAEDSSIYSLPTLNTPNLPVKELAEANGGAVVLIRTPTGLGSGFMIHPDGYLITNDHVIAGEHEISVTVFEETPMEMKKAQYNHVRIVASSPDDDLALLKIEPKEDGVRFDTVPLGESDGLRQGQTVFAIGNPLGLERSVSQGIISLRNRLIGGRLYVQTTAQINSGNSGGPLFNTRGEVIGVNNMKVAATGAEGLAFAIPSRVVKDFLQNRDVFAFDPRNPNAGFRYNSPPKPVGE